MPYSQHDEERYILAATADIPAGRFLDIGAYSPKTFSNTRALYECGWSGTMVEIAPGPMRSLILEYGNDDRITLIQAAVDAKPGLMAFDISDDALSTSNKASYERWRHSKGFLGRVLVPTITLEHLNGPGPSGFDFVNIDIEGNSADLFLRMLEIGMLPRCCCVELDGRREELSAAASKAGYTLLHVNGENGVFARS